MKQRGGMPYDVVAFSTDERAMLLSLEAEGAFHRLLRHAWINGSIPEDMMQLREICRAGNIRIMRRIWLEIGQMWVPVSTEIPHRLKNLKQESEKLFVSQRSESARISAGKRWETKENVDANALRTQSDGNAPRLSPSLPVSTKGKEEREGDTIAISSRNQEPKYTAEFESFWKSSTQRGSKKEAFGAWRIVQACDVEAVLSGMAAWRQSEQWQDETKQPHVFRWLKRRGWEEKIPKPNGGSANGQYHESPADRRERERLESSERVAAKFRKAGGGIPDRPN